MAIKHGQDRSHKGHLSESFRNAIGDEISGLESFWIKIEFERALLSRLTYVFQDTLRMLVANALTHFTTDSAFSHTLECELRPGRAGRPRRAARLRFQRRAK